MQVEPRKYRFRVLNASVSRSYDLSLDTGEPLVVVGTDGGLMPHPQPCSHVKVAMAERYEIVIDFSKYRAGHRVVLRNTSPQNNIDYDTTGVVMAFEVGGVAHDPRNNEIPRDLNPNTAVMGLTGADVDRDDNGEPIVRNVRFERRNSHWTVNGQTWEDVVNSGYELTIANPKRNATEIWELENAGGGWFHPVHIHLVDFKILDRNGRPPEPYELGAKDVVYVGESEKVRVIMKFEHQVGRYMMHCHNLVHEDHDMMVQFEVGDGGDDPIDADPCQDNDQMGPLFEVRATTTPVATAARPRSPSGRGARSGRLRARRPRPRQQGRAAGQAQGRAQGEAHDAREARAAPQAEAEGRGAEVAAPEEAVEPRPVLAVSQLAVDPRRIVAGHRASRARWSAAVLAAALLSLLSGWIHFAYVTSHWESWWAYGAFFVATGLLQGLLAPALLRWPGSWTGIVGIAGNLAIVAMYLKSRADGSRWARTPASSRGRPRSTSPAPWPRSSRSSSCSGPSARGGAGGS
jgi:Multicopper oxidase